MITALTAILKKYKMQNEKKIKKTKIKKFLLPYRDPVASLQGGYF